MMTYSEHKTNPCKECRNRYPACHDSCASYQEWNMARLSAKRIAMKKQDTSKMFEDYRKHAIENMSTKHRESWTAKHHRRIKDEGSEMEADQCELCADSVHVPDGEMD